MNYIQNYKMYEIYIKKEVKRGNRPKNRKMWSKWKKMGDTRYFEFHHIVPKCFGGDESENNLIPLTGREHFLAHYILCKIYENDSADKYLRMTYACHLQRKNANGFIYNSRLYEIIRKKIKPSEEMTKKARIKITEYYSNPDNIKKLSERMKKMYASLTKEERKKWGHDSSYNKNWRSKKVINLETLEIFTSIREASEKFKIPHIDKCCRNEINQTHNTFWSYYTTDDMDFYKNLLKEKLSLADINYKIRKCGLANKKYTAIKASTGEIFDSLKEACIWAKTNGNLILRSWKNPHFSAGKHPYTKEKLRWEVNHV